MTRRVTVLVDVEEILPGLPLLRVEYGGAEVFAFKSPDDDSWHSVEALPGLGCRIPEDWAPEPALPALVPILEAMHGRP